MAKIELEEFDIKDVESLEKLRKLVAFSSPFTVSIGVDRQPWEARCYINQTVKDYDPEIDYDPEQPIAESDKSGATSIASMLNSLLPLIAEVMRLRTYEYLAKQYMALTTGADGVEKQRVPQPLTAKEIHHQFILDMSEAEFEIYDNYNGRYFYHGPAVVVPKRIFQDVVRATKVDLVWDEMGLDLVVYPRASDSSFSQQLPK